MSRTTRQPNGARSGPADRTLLIAFLRYALDEVEAISPDSAAHLQMAIQSLEEEVRMDVHFLDVRDIGCT